MNKNVWIATGIGIAIYCTFFLFGVWYLAIDPEKVNGFVIIFITLMNYALFNMILGISMLIFGDKENAA